MSSTTQIAAPATREVLAAALLATFGCLGLVGPLAITGLFASGSIGMSSHGGSAIGPGFVDQLVELAPVMPVICVAAIVAAVGIYRRFRWGRRIALIVGSALVVAPLALLLATMLVPQPEFHPTVDASSDVVDLLLFQVFLMTRGPLGPTVFVPLLGLLVIWGVASRPRQRPAPLEGAAAPVGESATPGSRSARRPRLAMVTLAILAVLALAPYLAWVAAGRLGPATSETSGAAAAPSMVMTAGGPSDGGDGSSDAAPPIGSGPSTAPSGWDFGAGILIAIPTAIVAALAFIAARAIWSKAAYGPYIAPAAAALAGFWAAAWLLFTGVRLQSDASSGAVSLPVVVGWLLVALACGSALSFLPVTVSVLRRRAWFRDLQAPGAAPRSRRRRMIAMPGAVAAVLLAPIGIGAAAWAIDPPAEPLFSSDVLVGDRAYRYATPIDVDASTLLPAGTVGAWTQDLTIAATEVFSIPGTPADRAIVIAGGPADSTWELGLFVPSNDLSEGIPAELCRLVPLEDPGVGVEPCGPPWQVELGSTRYEQVSDQAAFSVTAGDLEPFGANVTIPAPYVDPRIGLEAMAIRTVPTTDAIALLVGRRVVLYRQSGRYGPGELCMLSPVAVANPLGSLGAKVAINEPPFGCGFPYAVWFDSTSYSLEQFDQELFDIPLSAVTPLGPALAEIPELGSGNPNGRQPFPPTIDATAYAITGVDPRYAIVFVVDGQVIVMRPKAFETPIQPELCPYARMAIIEELEASYGGVPVGCR